jgi:hypothetical protein
LRYAFTGSQIKNVAQRGPDEAAERLPAKQGGGGIAIKVQFSVWSHDEGTPFPNLNDEPQYFSKFSSMNLG